MGKQLIVAALIFGCSVAHAQSVLPLPEGRLSLAPTKHFVGDITGASTIYYTNDYTVYSDTGPWTANTLYDEFYSGSGICHQPWQTRVGGAPPPATTCTGIYVGSENADANGQFNAQKTPGPARHWDVWNAYNQKQIDLQVVDGASNQTFYAQSSWFAITPNSYATFIIGLPEQVSCRSFQQVYSLVAGYNAMTQLPGSSWGMNACGWDASSYSGGPTTWPNMTNQPPGSWGQGGADNWAGGALGGPGGTIVADYTADDVIGAHSVYAVVAIWQAQNSGAFVEFAGRNPPVERMMHIRFWG